MELYLITGPRYSGKSTAARGVALTLKYSYLDDDFSKDAIDIDYKTFGRGLMYAIIESVGSMFSTRGIVYAIDWDLKNDEDCIFVEKIYALCMKNKWLLHVVFLETDQIATMRNMVKLLKSYGLLDPECKYFAEEFFSRRYIGRYYPLKDEMKRYCDSYISVPANILVAKGVISYILEKISEGVI